MVPMSYLVLVIVALGLLLGGSLVLTAMALKRSSVTAILVALLLSGAASFFGVFSVEWINIVFLLQLLLGVGLLGIKGFRWIRRQR
jgi:hypothetical protein